MQLLSLISEVRHPFLMIESRIRKPLRFFARNAIKNYNQKTSDGVTSLREILFKGGVIALITSVIVWVSIFMYVAFYYTYMPNITHSRPVHLQFKSCDEHKGMCSYPSAHVRLTKRQQLLMVGQQYRLTLSLEMPESEVNKNLGMFMCCAELRARRGVLSSSSCRSGLLPYRSPLHTFMATIWSAPALILGFREEKTNVQLELYSDFEDDQNQPVTDVYVEIQSRHIEIYSATLNIDAHFTGLRYLMFNWPVLSAAVGVSTNLMFVALVCAISWYHLQPQDQDEDLYDNNHTKDTKESSQRKKLITGGGTENYLFDSCDLSIQDSLSVKVDPDGSHSSDDASFLDEGSASHDSLDFEKAPIKIKNESSSQVDQYMRKRMQHATLN